MGKYTIMGFFLAIALFLVTGVYINHSTNTANMELVDIGIKTSMLGYERDTGETSKTTATYGMRAKDVVSAITDSVVNNQSDLNKSIAIDYKFYTDEDGRDFIAYDTAINENSIVKSVQYKVNIYNSKDVVVDGSGNTTIKSGAQAESSTENRIVLSKLK